MQPNSSKYIYEKVEQQLNNCWCSKLLKDSINNRVDLQYKKIRNNAGVNNHQFIHMLKPSRQASKENSSRRYQLQKCIKDNQQNKLASQINEVKNTGKSSKIDLSKLLENVNRQQDQYRFTFARKSSIKKDLQIKHLQSLAPETEFQRFKNKQQLKPLGSTRVNSSRNFQSLIHKSKDNFQGQSYKPEAQVQHIQFSEQFSEIKQAESQHIVFLSRLNQSGVSGISRYISKVQNNGKLKVYGQIKYHKEQEPNLQK